MTPSYVFNILTISGKRHELEQFRQFAEGCNPVTKYDLEGYSQFCLNRFAPIQGVHKTITSLEAARREAWGCSSNADGIKLKESAHELRYSFTTHNTIPRKALEAMVKMFPSLYFDLQFKNDRRGVQGAMKVHKGIPHFAQTDKFAKEQANVG